ncbi:peptidyl-tRNA hydrolase 2, mitochondrial [Caerostris extrusa]|uniref:peptidyl-tRNA hydrolase n=1 Tax=Caerostris extrusa TaxID=172846 RepID=A0AAV4XMQ1_CAEEX|nr:peptidyl-tRNA hydrolase 2, mitochondrial [Caerostris extrusa]
MEGNSFNTVTLSACTFGCGMLVGYVFAKWLREQESESKMNSQASYKNSSDEEMFSDFAQGDQKLVLVVQNGLKMGKGKMAAQCAHASVMAYQHCVVNSPQTLKKWLRSGQRKVVVKVESEEALMELAVKARKAGLIVSLVCDAGRTQIPSGSRTVLAVGPGQESLIDKITGHLKLL